jgi:hypothetical protein
LDNDTETVGAVIIDEGMYKSILVYMLQTFNLDVRVGDPQGGGHVADVFGSV